MSSTKLRKMDKKGQLLETVGGTVVAFMVLLFIIFAVLFGISALNPGSFFTANSAEANQVTNFTANITSGVGEIGKQTPNIFKILAVVLVLGGIVLLIFYIRRMQGVGGESPSAL